MSKILLYLVKIILISIALYAIHGLITQPKLDRDWNDDQKILQSVEFKENEKVEIKNIRNISYRTTSDYDLGYYDKIVDLNKIDSAWYVIEPFGKFGAAHTLVSFGFSDGTYLAVSVEIRKEKGESFSALKGVFRQYEISYVIADEADVIKLRTNYRKDKVRLYPIKADKEVIKLVFIDMLERSQKLTTKPEFYNTVSSNCATNIVGHVRKFSDKDIPWYDLRYLMPEYSDEVAHEVGIIDTDLSIENAREFFDISEKAQSCSINEDFSVCIRK